MLLPALAGIGLLGMVTARAWVCDDAYISFRVIDNLLSGHGLRWNVDERVEVFSHPLWLLLQVPWVALFGNVFWVSLALSGLCLAASLGVVLHSQRPAPVAAACALLLPLALAGSFVDYATSGLENPLSFLLLAVFGALLLRGGAPGFALGLCTGLALLNRLDTLFLYLPPLGFALFAQRRRVAWARLALGFLPLLGWQLFRLLYYGFALPNPRYAKLGGGVPAEAYLRQGLRYLEELALVDPVGFLLLLAGPGAAAVLARRGRGGAPAALGAGAAAYIAYVIAIGGDFMSGRMWTLPIFAGAWLLLLALRRAAPLRAVLVLGLFAAAQLAEPWLAEARSPQRYRAIVDERAFYADSNALFANGQLRRGVSQHVWARQGAALRLRRAPPPVHTAAGIGMLGYYAGPGVQILELHGIGDALLARLPAENLARWRVGHLRRALPPGYRQARHSGSLAQMEPALAAYYREIRRVTSEPIFDAERLRAVAGFLLGRIRPPPAS